MSLGGVCLISIIAMVIILCNPKVVETPFEAPAFAENAQIGAPEVPKELGWSELHQEGMDFKVGICGNLQFEEHEATLYFTNPEENEIWMKLRITDQKGKVLAETGLIKPGEYIKAVAFEKKPKAGSELEMKVMTYEPDTYYSAGTVTMRTTVQ